MMRLLFILTYLLSAFASFANINVTNSAGEVKLYRDHLGNIREVISETGAIEQVTHYYPFGTPFSDGSGTAPDVQPYKYNGKEFDAMHGLNTYDYGARQYDPLLAVWHGVDPLCEKDYGTGATVYCRNNPIKFVDTDGKIIIFINGKIGWGSPYAGSTYWNGLNSRFVNGAKNFFNDHNIFFGSEDYGFFSSADERTKEGYEYGKKHYHEWKSNMKDNESFKFVSHSMGGAFSKGIENYIKEQGENVEYNLMINTYQVDKIKNSRDSKTFYIDYQNTNDPVLFLFDSNMGKGRLENSNLEIREKSNEKFIYIHKSPINSEEIWDTIKESLRKK